MFFQNKKYKPWSGKNYFFSILQFFIHAIVLAGLFLLTTFLYRGADGFVDYIIGAETFMYGIYALICIFMLCAVLYLYFYCEFRDYLLRAKNIAVLFISIELSFIICVLLSRYYGIFSRPTALCALLILLLVNYRSAVFINIIYAVLMLCTDILSGGNHDTIVALGEFITALSVGHFAVYLVNNVGSRIKVFGMGFIISVPIAILAFAFTYEPGSDVKDVLVILLEGLMSGVLSVTIMMAFLPFFEYVFNILTNYRLAEITDHKSKLISKMFKEAPGTFQHSLVVSTLAETCATAIGENPLLARAAAYYHDMGKLKQPIYFTENQTNGYNPHDELTPELSAEIIKLHTVEGYDLIKKFHLPLILADVAREHHGTLPIQYFYNKALKFTDDELDIKDFSYPGPKPSTKIAAIIMLADGCEAAVRAQNDRSREKVETVVTAIVNDRMKLDQFSDCEITMREIEIIRNALIDSLSGVYHDRIKYPKMKDKNVNGFVAGDEKDE